MTNYGILDKKSLTKFIVHNLIKEEYISLKTELEKKVKESYVRLNDTLDELPSYSETKTELNELKQNNSNINNYELELKTL
ncbi:hypothetical protein BCR32DRAFT_285451 [Anaeromyces robustus]|uniref:Uncharacterized protein n=1 Tax=Anaeromyces robustus TaxID=1754192 RepID=A0A1Y1WNL1_9FUNG|nr:hypothetical protein BCR32DRAFT_285451 [Anaeromyces robustus]|eukprot:ORX75149.1 hypothetical protein BCR32DRAFT_285451 [Anaeromyces robustus]